MTTLKKTLLIIGAVVIVGAVALVTLDGKNTKPISEDTDIATSTPEDTSAVPDVNPVTENTNATTQETPALFDMEPVVPKAKVSTEGWKTCTNKKHGYTFQYPANWTSHIDTTEERNCEGAHDGVSEYKPVNYYIRFYTQDNTPSNINTENGIHYLLQGKTSVIVRKEITENWGSLWNSWIVEVSQRNKHHRITLHGPDNPETENLLETILSTVRIDE